MKHLNEYNKMPDINDYVIIKPRIRPTYGISIGQIYSKYGYNAFFIKYIIPNGNIFNDMFYINEILFFSKNKNDAEKYMERYIATTKYNL